MKTVTNDDAGNSDEMQATICSVHPKGSRSTDPVCVEVTVDGIPVRMEVDTGAAVPVVRRTSEALTFDSCSSQVDKLWLQSYPNPR